jgi:hypothetical protein
MFLQTSQTTQAALINPHPGLVGWWSFNEGSGTVVSDSSGNGNAGAINGATWVDGKYGKALSFDGNNYVSTSNWARPINFTCSCWIKPTSTSGNAVQILGWSNSDMSITPFILSRYNNVIFVGFQSSANDYRFYKTTFGVLNDGVWCHVTVTYTGNSLPSIYINGVLASISPLWVAGVDTVPTSSLPFAIGRAGVYASRYFDGIIDEVRIYNFVLSQAEIQNDFNIGPDFSANVLAKVPQGTTQVITTLTWQGTGNINVTIVSPSQNYTENLLPEYQKSSYSTSNGITSMLNIKRLSVSVTALSSDQNWYMVLTLDKVDAYQITVEVQK